MDNFTSRGEEEPITDWTDENSFLWVGELNATSAGAINLTMQQQIGGLDPAGDNNPILQGIVVHRASPGAAFEISSITRSADEIVLQWNSSPGREYAVEFTTNLANPIWIELDDGVQSEGAQTAFTDDEPGPSISCRRILSDQTKLDLVFRDSRWSLVHTFLLEPYFDHWLCICRESVHRVQLILQLLKRFRSALKGTTLCHSLQKASQVDTHQSDKVVFLMRSI